MITTMTFKNIRISFYLAEIDVRLHDGVEAALVDADDLHAQESGAEHGLGAAETLVADGHDL